MTDKGFDDAKKDLQQDEIDAAINCYEKLYSKEKGQTTQEMVEKEDIGLYGFAKADYYGYYNIMHALYKYGK